MVSTRPAHLQGLTWTAPARFTNETFVDVDFSDANFDGVLFVDCTFQGCVFHKGAPGDLALFGCNFTGCTFTSFDFRRISVGANGGIYRDCVFSRCNFAGRHFASPHFAGCTFDRCKLKNVNFNDASFEATRFLGRIEDTTFNGLYHTHATGFAPLDRVDFSDAILGEFVTFEACDLSTCIPPRGASFSELLYEIDAGDATILSTGNAERIVLTTHRPSNRS